jgi:hypothetical protein
MIQDLPGVDRDLARPARARQAHLRLRVLADDRGVQVAEAVDLRAAEEGDVDQAGLEVVGEELEHRRDRGRARYERRVPDRQREPLGPRAEHPRLVHELQLGGHGALREVAHDVRQANADEAVAHTRQQARRRGDHDLVLRVAEVGGLAHAYLP